MTDLAKKMDVLIVDFLQRGNTAHLTIADLIALAAVARDAAALRDAVEHFANVTTVDDEHYKPEECRAADHRRAAAERALDASLAALAREIG